MAPPAIIMTGFSEVATETTPTTKHTVNQKKGSHAEMKQDTCRGTRCEQSDSESEDVQGNKATAGLICEPGRIQKEEEVERWRGKESNQGEEK